MRFKQENAHKTLSRVTGTKETLNKLLVRQSKEVRKPGLEGLWVICSQSLPGIPGASVVTF